MEEENINPEVLAATFQSLSAEGDILLQRGNLHEAIMIYSKAIEIRPDDKHCLVQRSRCYIQIGSPSLALVDANSSLVDNPNYHKGVFLKAEALYAQGNFELALLYFHRGSKLRPELNEFRVGIIKCREAINNSIGDPKRMKIAVSGKLRKNWQTILDAKDQGDRNTAAGTNLPSSMESKLLEEMYEDKVYLQGFLADKDFNDFPDDKIHELVTQGLDYLTTRLGFWRQQNPIYARKTNVEKKSSQVNN